MDSITLLNTSIGSTNKGDEIIMRCVEEELKYLLKNYFVISVSTHLRNFGIEECLFRLPDSASEVFDSKYKFVGGSNLLSSRMLHRTNQWNINFLNSKPYIGSILVGVGSLTGEKLDFYTKKLYKKVLSPKYIHSVREEKAYKLLRDSGFQVLNTGCVTLWKLTDDFCQSIPKTKSDKVVFTLTDYKKDYENDRIFIEIIKENYDTIYFWVQGKHDLEYLKSITTVDNIKIIEPSVDAYENILKQDIDYIGTRLHAGIYALRHGRRSIIIGVDDRMSSMQMNIKNNFIFRKDIDLLNNKINSKIETKINIDWDSVKKWKEQFL